jgi:RNA recognition motif-containing protein
MDSLSHKIRKTSPLGPIDEKSGQLSPNSLDSEERALEHIAELIHGKPNIASVTSVSQSPIDNSFEFFEGWGLLISIEGVDFDYQFTENDLRTVFQRYGRLTGVDTLSPQFEFGRVWFAYHRDAEAAITDLDNKILNGIHGRLRVVWDPLSIQKMESIRSIGGTFDQGYGIKPRSGLPPSSGVRKYTCRFDIAIENDKDFQVARRIIGSKGCNMKKIVDVSGAKLRLRGKGSGYLEGANREESPEPLHLCVSCTSLEGYNAAVNAVTEILEGVYDEYRRFYTNRRVKPDMSNLKVVVREMPLTGTVQNNDSSFEYPSSPDNGAAAAPQKFDSGYWKVPN